MSDYAEKELGYKEGTTRSKDNAIRSVGKTDGKKGYSLAQARSIEEETRHNPMVNLSVNLFTYVGTRIGALKDIVWSFVKKLL